jgi:phage terminase large subunit-like protein
MGTITRRRLQKPISTKPDHVLEYVKAVLSGAEVAGPHVRAACERHLRDLEHGHKRGLRFHQPAADRVFGYFETVLRLSEGQFEGRPFILHPSQKFILGSIFGWQKYDEKEGLWLRRFRRAYIEEGKGNGKSPLAGGIGLYAMSADGEARAQVYSAGANKDQAKILFNDAVSMAKQSTELAKRITFSGKSNVYNMAMLSGKQAGSFFRPISREAGKRGSGPRPHFALCDEIHEYPDRNTMEMLERGFKSRLQPLLLMTTNSGTDRNSICFEEHEHARKVAYGSHNYGVDDDTTFSYVCALDDGDDPLKDPSCWRKANPLLGVIIKEEYLAGVVKQALDIPGKQNAILRLHFCVWTVSLR